MRLHALVKKGASEENLQAAIDSMMEEVRDG